MQAHRTFVLLAIFTGFLGVCCISLLTLLLVRELEYRGDKGSREVVTLETRSIIVIKERYPGYFRTPEEQAEFTAKVGATAAAPTPVRNTSAVHKRCIYNSFCENDPQKAGDIPISESTTRPMNFNGTNPPNGGGGPVGVRKRRQIGATEPCNLDQPSDAKLNYHGCCVSHRYFISPDVLPTAEPGQQGDVQVLQYDFLAQFFSVEECCQAKDCNGCQCSQTHYVVSAVVVRAASIATEFVRIPGCCQCRNFQRPDSE